MKYNTILQVISNYVEKCWSIAQIQEKLSALSNKEIRSKLEEILTPLQLKIYDDWKGLSSATWLFKKDREFCKKMAFNVERKLFEKQEPKNVSYDINKYDVLTETQNEEKQIDSQNNIEYTPTEMGCLKGYFGPQYELINSYLYGYGEWNKRNWNSEAERIFKNRIRNISNAIKKNTTVEPMVVYHSGFYDPSKGIGDNITFKGFTSCSYSKEEAKKFLTSPMRVEYRFLLPKGTPCLSGNGKDFDGNTISGHPIEKEILLDKNFKGKIVDITDNVITIEAV